MPTGVAWVYSSAPVVICIISSRSPFLAEKAGWWNMFCLLLPLTGVTSRVSLLLKIRFLSRPTCLEIMCLPLQEGFPA